MADSTDSDRKTGAMSLTLRNPHSILAAIAVRPTEVLEVRLPPGGASGLWLDVKAAAQTAQIPLKTALPDPPGTGRRDGPRGGAERAGVACALVRERADVSLETLFSRAAAAPDAAAETPSAAGAEGGLWLALDCLQDPQNVGAIFRTAAFFGVRGIVVTRDRSAPLSATVYDVASGGMEAVPFAQPTNLSRALQSAKEAGLWILGTSEHAQVDYQKIGRDRPWLLVLGNEEHGLRRLTLETCDEVCCIPPRGLVGSLNVSAAAAVMISHLSAGPSVPSTPDASGAGRS